MKRILHTEQSEFFRGVIQKIAESMGMEYHGAQSSAEAMEVLHDQTIDLVISGLELKKESGIAFIEGLNDSEFRDLPVVVLTGNESPNMRRRLFSLGVLDYLLKKEVDQGRFGQYLNLLYKQDAIMKALRGMNIAVVDDSQVSIRIIRKIFEANKIDQVDYYTSAGDLFSSSQQYQMYVVDVVMPNVSGEEVILRLRERSSKCIILSVSGISNLKTITNVLISGADDYILKPFDSTVFLARIKSCVRTYRLIEALEHRKDRLEVMAVTDGLTGTFNHKFIHQLLDEEVLGAQLTRNPLSIALLDLDDFKLVNDKHGHVVGDQVLGYVSQVLLAGVRKGDSVGRYGGEEFLILMPGASAENAAASVTRMLEKVRAFEHPEKDLAISFSAGVVELSPLNAHSLIDEADRLLYRAKDAGKNRILY